MQRFFIGYCTVLLGETNGSGFADNCNFNLAGIGHFVLNLFGKIVGDLFFNCVV